MAQSLQRRLVLAGLATVLGLGLVELGLRITGLGLADRSYSTGGLVGDNELTITDPELLIRLRPNAEFLGYYRLNERGWRGPPVPASAPEGALRIVTQGDSCTFGLGVRADETWPNQLDRMLDGAFEGVLAFDVVNAGVPGYSTWQNRVQLQTDVLGLEPDLVIAMPTGHNDTSGTHDLADEEATRHNRGLSGLAVVRVATQGTRQLARLASAGDDPDAPREPIPPGTPGAKLRVPPTSIRANLQAMTDDLGAAGVAFVLVAGPHSASSRAAVDDYVVVEEIVAGVAVERGLPLADPRTAIAAYEPHELFVDTLHPDREGQRLIATSILGCLLGTDELLPAWPRRAFLRAWWAARDGGVAAAPVSATLEHAPAAFLDILDVYRARPDLDELLRRGETSLPDAVRHFDPIHGSERGPYQAGGLRWLARDANPEEAAALTERAALIAATVVPPDPLSRLLPELARGERPTADDLALARAIVVFDHVLGLVPVPYDARRAAARQLSLGGEMDAALAQLDAALALAPASAPILAERGMLLRRMGRAAESRACFETIIQQDPDSPVGHAYLGSMALRQGRRDEAETLLLRALDADPSYAQARYLLGRLLLEDDRLEDAEVQLRTAAMFGGGAFPDIPALLAEVAARRQAGEEATGTEGSMR